METYSHKHINRQEKIKNKEVNTPEVLTNIHLRWYHRQVYIISARKRRQEEDTGND